MAHNTLEYRELTEEEAEIMTTLYGRTDFVRVGPKGYVYLKKFVDLAADIYDLEVREGDYFVTSYSRSGTTWCQELVWLIANDCDFEKATAVPLNQRYQFLDVAMYFDDETVKRIRNNATNADLLQKALAMATPATKILPNIPSPRFIKSHLPPSMLPANILDTAKVVYMARDPRDMIVSYYHLLSSLIVLQLKGSFKEFWNSIKKDMCLRMPYFEQVKESWAKRHHPNMLFLFYEELLFDLPGVIKRVAEFFGKNITSEQIEQLRAHLSFDNIRQSSSVNLGIRGSVAGALSPEVEFIRKGKVGGWREYFDEEMEKEVNQWIADNLRGTDLVYPTINGHLSKQA